jgi:cytochrome c-type biogenesis protein CcsB
MRELKLESSKSFHIPSYVWYALAGVGISLIIGLSGLNNLLLYKLAFFGYAISFFVYFAFVILRNNLFSKLSTGSLSLAVMLNLSAMIARMLDSYKIGLFHPPWTDLFEALTFWSFIVGVVYLYIEQKYGYKLMGSIVTFFISGIYLFAMLKADPNIEPLMPSLRSYWLYIHVLTAFLGYAGFTVAFAAAVFYLIKYYAPNHVKAKLPPEDVLDEIAYKSVAIVFPIWTASIILGAAWADEAWGGYWSWDPKEVWALIVLLFFGAYLHARYMMGWKGPKVAWMVVIGFIAILICFFAINLYFPGLHSYAKS